MKRSKTSKQWMKEHVSDVFVLRARAAGYRSRAAYKLAEIAARDKLLKSGMTVVDLGAAPGGWSQVAREQVGARGRVIALDVLDMAPLAGVHFLCGDIRAQAVLDALEQALDGGRVDLVLSDMSPNISGISVSDQARAMRARFTSVVTRKPAASRGRSSETYLLGRNLRTGSGLSAGLEKV